MAERDRKEDAAEQPGMSRREFVSTAAATGAAFMIVPRHVLGRGMTAPSDLVNVAIVGINGMGSSNARAVMGQNIVAICDCDDKLLEGKLKQWQDAANAPPPQNQGGGQGRQGGQGPRPLEASKAQLAANEKFPRQSDSENLKKFVSEQIPKLKKYRDYRKMLDQQKDIDGVIVATPDHMHAVIASNAMDAGKHVYVQKPLCWSVHECRHLVKKAKEKTNLVTQMGNQGHSGDHARTAVEFIQAGGLGEIKEVHVWTNRPLGYWPQGVPRPAPLSADQQLTWNNQGVERRLAAAMKGNFPVPDTLAWDLFLGVAPEVEYHPIYHPFNWRGWVDWGQGALGDMGAHLIDHPVWSLKLGLPTVIETISTPFNKASYPNATMTYYEFAARGNMPAVKMTWYDGGFMPPKPDELTDSERLNAGGGILYVGSKGKMLQDTYGENPRLIPTAANDPFVRAPETLPRVAYSTNGHEMNWVNAIKGRDKISSPFEYAAHLNEIMLLGVASLRSGNLRLHYDGPNMKFTNSAANEFLTRAYRQGFAL